MTTFPAWDGYQNLAVFLVKHGLMIATGLEDEDEIAITEKGRELCDVLAYLLVRDEIGKRLLLEESR